MIHNQIGDSYIVKNTIPKHFFGVSVKYKYGLGFTFMEYEKKQVLQAQGILRVLNFDSDELVGEFRTVTNVYLAGDPQDTGFNEKCLFITLAAVRDFNRELKLNDSDLTVNRSYANTVSIESIKEPITQAYLSFIVGLNRPAK